MSPLPQVRMSPPALRRTGGPDGGRGSLDEHRGAGTFASGASDAREAAVATPGLGASGYRPAPVQTAGAIVEAAGRRRPGLPPARPAIEQPVAARRTGADRDLAARQIPRLRPHTCGGEASGARGNRGLGGDGAAVADRPRPLASEEAPAEADISAARATAALRRADPDRRQPARLVRGPRPPLHANRIHR